MANFPFDTTRAPPIAVPCPNLPGSIDQPLMVAAQNSDYLFKHLAGLWRTEKKLPRHVAAPTFDLAAPMSLVGASRTSIRCWPQDREPACRTKSYRSSPTRS